MLLSKTLGKQTSNEMESRLISKKKFWGVILSVVLILGLSSYPIFRFLQEKLPAERDIWDSFSYFFGGPVTAVITLLVTAMIAIYFREYEMAQIQQKEQEQKKNLILSLFADYRKRESRVARINAGKFKKIWEASSRKNRKLMIIAMIHFEPRKIQCKDGKEALLKVDYIHGVYDVLDFYCALKEYQPDRKIMQEASYFFYDWWRKFLYEVARIYEKENDKRLNPELEKKLEKYKEFKGSLQFTRKLKELDVICGFQGLDEEFEIYLERKTCPD